MARTGMQYKRLSYMGGYGFRVTPAEMKPVLRLEIEPTREEYEVARVPAGESITIDGKLDEDVWKRNFAGNGRKLGSENTKDFNVEFALVWDPDTGLYFGAKFNDDAHRATKSIDLKTAKDGYADDRFEFWVSSDFDRSAKGDPRFGLQHVLGFGHPGDPQKQYSGYWDDMIAGIGPNGFGVDGAWTPAEAKQKGWLYRYTTDDGVNFEVECLWLWYGHLMGRKAPPRPGERFGFDLSANDVDPDEPWGTRLLWSGRLRNANPLHWVKLVLQ